MSWPPPLPSHAGSEVEERWERVAADFHPTLGVHGLVSVCTLIVRLEDAARRIKEDKMIVKNDKGGVEVHPCISVEQKCRGELSSWIEKFGKSS